MTDRHLSCEEVIERLFDYLDGELDPASDADLDRHLARCRECFSRAEFERRLRQRVADAGETRAPERLRRRVRELMDDFEG